MTAEALTTWIVGSIIGVLEVPVFQWVKSALKIDDKAAFAVVMAFSVLLAFIALGLTGGFSPFDVENLFVYATSIITLGQLTYGLWKK